MSSDGIAAAADLFGLSELNTLTEGSRVWEGQPTCAPGPHQLPPALRSPT